MSNILKRYYGNNIISNITINDGYFSVEFVSKKTNFFLYDIKLSKIDDTLKIGKFSHFSSENFPLVKSLDYVHTKETMSLTSWFEEKINWITDIIDENDECLWTLNIMSINIDEYSFEFGFSDLILYFVFGCRFD